MGVLQSTFRVLYNQVLPFLLVAAGIIGVWLTARSLEPFAFDRLMRITAPKLSMENSPVELILLDDTSLDQLIKTHGSPPWSWEVYQSLYETIKPYDPALVVFATPFNQLNQKRLAALGGTNQNAVEALEDKTDTSLPAIPASPTPGNFVFGVHLAQKRILTIPDLNWYSMQLGITNIDSPMTDGIVRTLKPYWFAMDNRGGSGVYPSIALASVFDFLNRLAEEQGQAPWLIEPKQPFSSEGGLLRLQTESTTPSILDLPLDSQQRMLMRWYEPLGTTDDELVYTHPALPLHLLASKELPENLLKKRYKGKIVLFGSASSLYRDVYATPVSHRHLGIDIHATGIHNMLRGHMLRRAESWKRSLSLLASFFLVFYLRIRFEKFSRTVLYLAACMLLYFWFVVYNLNELKVIYDIVTPEIFMLLGMLAGTLWWSSQRDREIKTLTHNMAQLVSPSVFQEVLNQQKGIQPGGQRMMITVMMVDIRNFTTLAENLPAKELTDLLNAVYAVVERIAFAHRGTIDKYLGDGVMVLFGAPLETTDHADEALHASVALLDSLQQLAEQWWKKRHIFFQVGISLNSGPAFVGFIGPSKKMEYTALGDTVNLSARLQEQNKEYQTPLIVSESTFQMLSQDNTYYHQLIELGSTKIRGRQAMVKVYSLPQLMLGLTS